MCFSRAQRFASREAGASSRAPGRRSGWSVVVSAKAESALQEALGLGRRKEKKGASSSSGLAFS